MSSLRCTIHWHDRLPSTNAFLLEWARRDASLPDGTVVAARQQDAGRGRRGRAWQSAPGRDLAFSLLLRPNCPPGQLPSLPLLASLTVCEALECHGVAPRVKWPNDVRVDGCKIAGILVEAMPSARGAVIVGIGVNVNSSAEDLSAVGQPATSLSVLLGGTYAVEDLLGNVLASITTRYSAWQRGGFSVIREEWTARAEALGQRVLVSDGNRATEGIAVGYGDRGELLLRTPDGATCSLLTGELGYLGTRIAD
jgi:BirA family biotin operon repressor/biotin-[acetyl-CoA-carboxylase] ligase